MIINPIGVKDGEIIHITMLDEKQRGLNCGCVCPECGQPLVARMGEINTWHFAHKSESNCDFGASRRGGESPIHKLAKKVIYDNKMITIEGETVNFKDVIVEYKEDDVILDLLGITTDGEEIGIEIYYKHKVEDEKIEKLKKRYKKVIEIDIPAKTDTDNYEEFTHNVLSEFSRLYIVYKSYTARDIQQSLTYIAEQREILKKEEKRLEEKKQEIDLSINYLQQQTEEINRKYEILDIAENTEIKLAEREEKFKEKLRRKEEESIKTLQRIENEIKVKKIEAEVFVNKKRKEWIEYRDKIKYSELTEEEKVTYKKFENERAELKKQKEQIELEKKNLKDKEFYWLAALGEKASKITWEKTQRNIRKSLNEIKMLQDKIGKEFLEIIEE